MGQKLELSTDRGTADRLPILSPFRQSQRPKIMYVNFRKDEPRQWCGGTVTPMDDGVFPVEMLFNENSSAGEVRPLSTGTVRLRGEDGRVKPFAVEKGENLVLGHEDLEEKGAQILKKDASRAWGLSADERRKYVDFVSEHGEVDEDEISELRARADMFGMEALTEDDQMLVDHLDEDTLFDVQDFMRQTGMDQPGYDPLNYGTYGETDTGRFVRIEMKEHPGTVIDAYEAPPSGNMHQFWNMHDTPGVPNFMGIAEGGFELKGVYEGRPFEAEYRDRLDVHRETQAMIARMPSVAEPRRMSALDRMHAEMDRMDGGREPGPEDGFDGPDGPGGE